MHDREPLVCFNHGKESGPWGIKITRLAEDARVRGFAVISPDYTHTMDPDERVRELVAMRPRGTPLVLAGSSMGGYVAAHACAALHPDALFLMAPALYFPGYDREPDAVPAACTVVHGTGDDIVPPAVAERFSATHDAALHLIDAGHTLNERLDDVAAHFGALLDRVAVR